MAISTVWSSIMRNRSRRSTEKSLNLPFNNALTLGWSTLSRSAASRWPHLLAAMTSAMRPASLALRKAELGLLISQVSEHVSAA
jgi:hypothetical protein